MSTSKQDSFAPSLQHFTSTDQYLQSVQGVEKRTGPGESATSRLSPEAKLTHTTEFQPHGFMPHQQLAVWFFVSVLLVAICAPWIGPLRYGIAGYSNV